MSNIASETWSCVPSPIQRAVIEAYREHEDIESHIRACTDIHALMSGFIATSLRNLGVIAPPPQGAFYNYPDFAPHRESLATAGIRTSTDLAGILLADYGLATLPGTAFGADPDSLTLRLSSCDYDGAAALAARQNGAPLDEAFIDSYAPHVRQAVETFGKFIRNIKKAAPTRIP
jgi:aspartate/methionine/tyrosine aminotransferase